MDIYQIIITHNRSWTIREIIAFAVVFLMAVFLAAILLRLHKIVIIQAVWGLVNVADWEVLREMAYCRRIC